LGKNGRDLPQKIIKDIANKFVESPQKVTFVFPENTVTINESFSEVGYEYLHQYLKTILTKSINSNVRNIFIPE